MFAFIVWAVASAALGQMAAFRSRMAILSDTK